MGIKGFFILQIAGISCIIAGFSTVFTDLVVRGSLGSLGITLALAATCFAWLLNGQPVCRVLSLPPGCYLFLGKHLDHLYFMQRTPQSARIDPEVCLQYFTEQVFKVPMQEFYHRDKEQLSECAPVVIRVFRTGRNERMLEITAIDLCQSEDITGALES